MEPLYARARRPSASRVEAGRDGARTADPPQLRSLPGSLGAGVVSPGARRAGSSVRTDPVPLFPRGYPPAPGKATPRGAGKRSRADGDRRVPDGPDGRGPAEPAGLRRPSGTDPALSGPLGTG